jgi:hypothetical protein
MLTCIAVWKQKVQTSNHSHSETYSLFNKVLNDMMFAGRIVFIGNHFRALWVREVVEHEQRCATVYNLTCRWAQ